MHITKNKAKKLVWKVISSMPIDVFDDDDGSIWEVGSYELRNPRPEGDYEGSREIGAANLVSAFNLLHQKMLIAELSSDDGFSDCGIIESNSSDVGVIGTVATTAVVLVAFSCFSLMDVISLTSSFEQT